MNHPVCVHLTGSDGIGWALDQDLETVWQALSQTRDLITLVPRHQAEVIHSAWSHPLVHADPADFKGRRVICHMCNDVPRALTLSAESIHRAADTIGLWIAMSRRAFAEMKAIGWRTVYIPYAVNTTIFNRTPPASRDALRKQHGIQADAYVVLNVMRDSQAADLNQPKPQKAPGSWVDILSALKQRGHPVHALLAGPRRHWIRAELARRGIGFTQIGQITTNDDVAVNILKPADVSALYHASDVCLITSRWEGGPRSILEAAATGTKVLSPAEGIAEDVLDPACVYNSFDEAIETMDSDIRSGKLAATIESQHQRILDSFTSEKNIPLFKNLYMAIDEIPVCRPPASITGWMPYPIRLRWRIFKRNYGSQRKLVFGMPTDASPARPWGAFLQTLRQELVNAGHTVIDSSAARPDVWILDQRCETLTGSASSNTPKIICMDDSPANGLQGSLGLATHVFHSCAALSTWKEMTAAGLLRPMIIPRVADPRVFHLPSIQRTIGNGAIKLAVAGGSPSGDSELARRLTGAGIPCELDRLPALDASSSAEDVAVRLMKCHALLSLDADATVPAWLMEAMACGLPVIHPRSGAYVEHVRRGGIAYASTDELSGCVERMRKSYEIFRNAVWFDDLRSTAKLYIGVAHDMLL